MFRPRQVGICELQRRSKRVLNLTGRSSRPFVIWSKGPAEHTNSHHAFPDSMESARVQLPQVAPSFLGREVAPGAHFLVVVRILFGGGLVVGDRELSEYFIPRSLHSFEWSRGTSLGYWRNRRR